MVDVWVDNPQSGGRDAGEGRLLTTTIFAAIECRTGYDTCNGRRQGVG